MKNPLREILQPKDLLNPYLAASVAGRLGNKMEVESRGARALDKFVGRTALSSFSLEDNIDPSVYSDTRLWHGTGRYKHEENGIQDVLKNIADTGQIQPKEDRFDFTGTMHTVSLAKSRMYARAYADMYGEKPDSSERYGDSLFWACAFLGSIAVEASIEMEVWKPSGYYSMMCHLGRAGISEWYKKVNSSPHNSMVDIYTGKSDIEGNYPVLFGVREVDGVKTSRAVALHEIRSDKPIDIHNDVTHVEVPERNIDETRKILGDLAIRSIEMGEIISSKHSFTEHMHEIL